MKNKIVALGLAFATLTWAAPMIGQAATTEELQAQITALLVQIAALQAQLQTPSTTACFTLQLKFGSTGSEVTALQTALKGDATVYPEGLVTGYFGSLTEKAVKAFQTKYGIEAVGQVGPITRAKLNTLFCVTPTATPTPTPTATPVAGPLTVTLASDNPAGANVQQGSANNTVAKFTFTAGSTAVNVTGLVFKSYGTVAATGNADITALKLFDENGIQLGTDRIQAGNQVNFVIVPALAIPASGSRTVSLAANIATIATSQVMATVRYGLELATAITGATFGGTYPVVGNSFMIVPAGQLGAVSVSSFGSVPKANVKIGEKDIVVERFNVAAGSNEDILVNQIILSSNAASTIADSDISNIRIRKISDSSVVAGPLTLSNKKATFNLTTPISLTKGASVNLEAVADIASGATLAGGRTIWLQIATGGVVARGATSGTNIVSTGNSIRAQGILIGIGTLTVSMSTNHPQGANALLITTTNKKTIAAFSVRANGEDIILNEIRFKFNDATQFLDGTNFLSAVGVYDGDSLISDLKTIDTPNNEDAFSLNYTIPANTTKELLVKAVTNTMTAVANDQLTTTWSYYLGYGLSSGETITSGTDHGTTAITMSASGKATLASESIKTPYSQGVLAPSNNVIIGALKVYAQREDLKLTKLVLTPVGTGYVADDISSVTLYADDGVTVLSNPISEAAGVFTITSATDLISDIVFTKSVYKTVLVKANANTSLTGVPDFHFTIANAADKLTFEGMDSAQPYDYDSDAPGAGWNFAFASPYAGGTFSFSQTLVEMKKSSTSPSGSVLRGSSQTYAVWDLTNVSSDTYDAKITAITLTSKTGLPTGAVIADFKLYDGDSIKLCEHGVAGCVVTIAGGAVTFTPAASLITIPQGTPKQFLLQIDTTSSNKYPSGTQMYWSLNAVGDATVLGGVAGATTGYVGYGGTTYSIPAITNSVTL